MIRLTPAVTWERLVEREPELANLYLETSAVKDGGGPSFCANKHWYIHVEPRLTELVGQRAQTTDPILLSPKAYELAYDVLYGLLPNCRNCICVPW